MYLFFIVFLNLNFQVWQLLMFSKMVTVTGVTRQKSVSKLNTNFQCQYSEPAAALEEHALQFSLETHRLLL